MSKAFRPIGGEYSLNGESLAKIYEVPYFYVGRVLRDQCSNIVTLRTLRPRFQFTKTLLLILSTDAGGQNKRPKSPSLSGAGYLRRLAHAPAELRNASFEFRTESSRIEPLEIGA